MLTPESFIDGIQSTKKVVVNTFIVDKNLNKILNSYIDLQTTFAKNLAQNATTMAKYSVDTFNSYWFPKKEETA